MAASRVSLPSRVPALTLEEEDQIILTRITNDERPIRRVMKKFHAYNSLNAQSLSSTQPSNPSTTQSTSQPLMSLEDAREAFLVELATFELSLKKSAMVCEAETRQVEEYRREKERIEQEHETLKEQIEQLKHSLEEAQLVRRRKIEYDLIAEKVNTLPSREELEQTIYALENDMAAIHSEHETQDRIIRGQKSALDGVVSELNSIRTLGKEADKDTLGGSSTPVVPSRVATPLPGEGTDGTEATVPVVISTQVTEREEGEEDQVSTGLVAPGSAMATTEESSVDDNDIEMGEVEEERHPASSGSSGGMASGLKARKLPREDLEEGEASDSDSSLTDLPDD